MRALALGTLVLTMAFSGVAAAEPSATDRAQALLQEGVSKRAEGKDEEALTLFRQSDALDSTPKSRAQLGLCEQALGMWVAAETHLREALEAKGDPWIDRNRAQLESAVARIASELGWVLVVDAPAGAEIRIDGNALGKSPLPGPLRAAAGARLVEVSAKGYEPYTRRVNVRSGEVSRERAVLLKIKNEAASSRGAPGDPRFVDVPTVSPLRTAGWIAVGVGTGVAAFGGAGLLIRQNYVDGYNSDSSCPGTAAAEQPPQCQSRKDNVSRWSAISVASLVAGGATAVTGFVLVLLAPQKTRVRVADRIELGCDSMGLGVQCMGSF